MRKSTILFSLLAGCMCAPASLFAAEEGYMEPATLVFPSTLNLSMPPMSVDITWDNQEITLVDPEINEYEEEVTMVYVALGDEDPMPVSAALLTSFGDDGEDVYELEAALYELDDIFDFTGETVTLNIPAGIVKNNDGLLNPEQVFVFNIMSTYTNYTETPATGSTLTVPDAFVTLSFGDNKLTYKGGSVTTYVYEPAYKSTDLNFGKEVTLNDDTEILIDLNSLPAGEYEMVLPEGMFSLTVDGEEYITPDLWFEYTIDVNSGVKSITVRPSDGAIYNLNGVKMTDADRLTPGIYVIEGHKVVIK